MNIRLIDLNVMQESLRHWEDIQDMSYFVSNGGKWTKDFLENYSLKINSKNSSLIVISVFEDGKKYIHDGLHRCVATYLGGRDFLFEEEYIIKEWKYEDYTDFAPENEWYTPFDPRTHLRIANLSDFKEKVKKLCEQSQKDALDWISSNSFAYKHLRQFSTLEEFILHFNEKLNEK